MEEGVFPQPTLPGLDLWAAECDAYHAQLQCLLGKENQCATLPTQWEREACAVIIDNEIRKVDNRIKFFCYNIIEPIPTFVPTPTPPPDKGNNPLP